MSLLEPSSSIFLGGARLDKPTEWSINPDLPDREDDLVKRPYLEASLAEYYKKTLEQHELDQAVLKRHREQAADSPEKLRKLPEPTPAPTAEAMKAEYEIKAQFYDIVLDEYREKADRYQDVMHFILSTVDLHIFQFVMLNVDHKYAKKHSVRQVLREIKNYCGPSQETARRDARSHYFSTLERASNRRIDPHAWITQWEDAYWHARELELEEVQGMTPVLDFLHAVEKRIDPVFAKYHLREAPKDDKDAFRYAGLLRSELSQPWTDWHLDTPSTAEESISGTESRKRKRRAGSKNCPCKKKVHPWKPEDCAWVQAALIGKTSRHIKGDSEQRISEIRETLDKPHWSTVKARVLKNSRISSS